MGRFYTTKWNDYYISTKAVFVELIQVKIQPWIILIYNLFRSIIKQKLKIVLLLENHFSCLQQCLTTLLLLLSTVSLHITVLILMVPSIISLWCHPWNHIITKQHLLPSNKRSLFLTNRTICHYRSDQHRLPRPVSIV